MIVLILLFPVLLFSQETCSAIDFKDSYIVHNNIELKFVFGKEFIQIQNKDSILYYKIKKKHSKNNYTVYWVNNYKLYVYQDFILQKKTNLITIYKLCRNKKL